MKKVTQVERFEGEYVKFDDGACYERYSKDNWRWRIGESTESEYHCEELEAAYVDYKLRKLDE